MYACNMLARIMFYIVIIHMIVISHRQMFDNRVLLVIFAHV